MIVCYTYKALMNTTNIIQKLAETNMTTLLTKQFRILEVLANVFSSLTKFPFNRLREAFCVTTLLLSELKDGILIFKKETYCI